MEDMWSSNNLISSILEWPSKYFKLL